MPRLAKLRGDAQHLVVIALRLGRAVAAAECGQRCADFLCLAFDVAAARSSSAQGFMLRLRSERSRDRAV